MTRQCRSCVQWRGAAKAVVLPANRGLLRVSCFDHDQPHGAVAIVDESMLATGRIRDHVTGADCSGRGLEYHLTAARDDDVGLLVIPAMSVKPDSGARLEDYQVNVVYG